MATVRATLRRVSCYGGERILMSGDLIEKVQSPPSYLLHPALTGGVPIMISNEQSALNQFLRSLKAENEVKSRFINDFKSAQGDV